MNKINFEKGIFNLKEAKLKAKSMYERKKVESAGQNVKVFIETVEEFNKKLVNGKVKFEAKSKTEKYIVYCITTELKKENKLKVAYVKKAKKSAPVVPMYADFIKESFGLRRVDEKCYSFKEINIAFSKRLAA